MIKVVCKQKLKPEVNLEEYLSLASAHQSEHKRIVPQLRSMRESTEISIYKEVE
ncbi:hypothetical protein [Bacillus sp. FJAT-27225]|uniref:hypothetical protein n=1 Tax=Bacillus sp. FJAT-27225 TaxID=1743144 RepID=UPI0015868098|nr:hypothetical protein [Bacillus sp. FJAT-27225]